MDLLTEIVVKGLWVAGVAVGGSLLTLLLLQLTARHSVKEDEEHDDG